MSRRLLNLRGVTADEADGLRDALTAARIEFYEIPPTAFGISAGSIWIRHEHEFERAQKIFDDFQHAFAARARADHVPESLVSYAKRNPRRVAGYAAAALAILLLMFWPVIQLWG